LRLLKNSFRFDNVIFMLLEKEMVFSLLSITVTGNYVVCMQYTVIKTKYSFRHLNELKIRSQKRINFMQVAFATFDTVPGTGTN
jgi:hypothetical protein